MALYRPFRFGAHASTPASYDDWISFARKVETLGYSTLVTGEHLSTGTVGSIAALMAAANATTTLRLGAHVFANDFRHPALLAHEAATLDLLSEGRLEFGLGSGWLRADYDAVGIPLDSPTIRIQRLEEAILLIKRLLVDEAVTFAGSHYHVQNLHLRPKPKQQPHPPIFIGGGGRRVLTLAAREADIIGLNPKGTAAGTLDVATLTAEAVAEQVTWVRQAAGMRFDNLEFHTLLVVVRVTEDRQSTAREVAMEFATAPATVLSNTLLSIDQVLDSPHVLIGTIDEMVEILQRRRERYGISYITVVPESIDAFSPVVAQLAGK